MRAGARMPYHCVESKPGTAASAIVGNSGTIGERFAPVTASARTLPARICGSDDGRLPKYIDTWPAIKSIKAGPAPL